MHHYTNRKTVTMTGSSSSSSSSNDDIDNSLASRSKRAQEPPSGADTAPSFWSLQIRTVNNKESDDFYVQVHPEDPIDKLYDKIESHTGLSQQQQRLIYRGRLLMSRHNNNNHSANEDKVEEKSKESRKIRDITGLCDGHCIHLVTRKVETPEGETDVTSEATRAESSNSSTGGGSSLLSAIWAWEEMVQVLRITMIQITITTIRTTKRGWKTLPITTPPMVVLRVGGDVSAEEDEHIIDSRRMIWKFPILVRWNLYVKVC